ncbi:serine-rich adhesin for platelets-like isoform X4 [Haliotis rufescens]|uniref:serine-rich adhesin for platelets-like isoform X4 n=1 Tax=Haliotis rufescens TaxID=6454 RepID=UPI00201F8A6C|nr:serine-rich adhesin for platelets-like isoform X4 [Haliotis rufescens]
MASRVTFVTGTAEVKRRDHNGFDVMEKPKVALMDGKCDCCPYGYHIDLDFVNFCENITSGSTLKQLKRIQRAKRKLRKSMEVMLQQQSQARMEEAGTPPPDVVHSTEASRLMHMVEYEQSSTHRILDEIDSSVDQTIAHIDYMMRPTRKQQRYFSSDSEDGISPVSPTRYNTFPLRRSPNGDESSHFATSLSTSGRTDSMSSLSSVSTVSSENPQGQIMSTHGGHGTQFVHTTATAEIAHPTHSQTMNQSHTKSHSQSHSTLTHMHSSQSTHQSQKYRTVTSAQLAETMATHFPQTERDGAISPQSNTANISKMSLSAIREAMAMSLQRMKDLEEQVKALPIMQVRISVLKEEKRLLMLQLKARNSKLNTRSVGVGDKSIHEVEVAESMPVMKIVQAQSPVKSIRFPEVPFSPMSPQMSPQMSPLKSPPPTLPKPKKSRTIGIGEHSVIEPYLLRPDLPTGYTVKENEVHTEIRTYVSEVETLSRSMRDMPRLETTFDPQLRSPMMSPIQASSPKTHITINQIQRGGPKALTRSIGVGDGNVFDNSGLHIHEKELRTVIIGQGGPVGKRNVGVECRVPTRDVGVSYVCDDEKPSTRTVGINVDTGSLLTSLSFKGEELRGALRDMLSKNVRSIGTNCNFRPLTNDVGTESDQIKTMTIGVGDCRTDVEVRAHNVMRSVGVGFHPEMTSRYVGTEKGWMLDQGTNTPVLDKKSKSTSTEKPRFVYASTNTDSAPLRNSSNQTDHKIFHATDQLKNVSCNTHKIAAQSMGVNTDFKCLKSDTFDFAITFQNESSNTDFSIADKGVNTDRGYSKKGAAKSVKTVGVSEDTVDVVRDSGQRQFGEQVSRSSVETVSTVRSNQSTTVNSGGSYMPADMSKFMSVGGSSSVKSKSSSAGSTEVKRRQLESSQNSSPKRKSGDDFEEYRYSEESFVIRGNDLEHGDFEIVKDLGGTEKRIVAKKSDLPLEEVLGIDGQSKTGKRHSGGGGGRTIREEHVTYRSSGTDLGLSRTSGGKGEHDRVDGSGGEAVGYIRYLQDSTDGDGQSGTSSAHSTSMISADEVLRQSSSGSSESAGGSGMTSMQETVTRRSLGGGGGGGMTTVQETVVQRNTGSRGGSGMTIVQAGGGGFTFAQGSGGGSGMTTIQGGGSGMTTIQGSGGGSGMTTIQGSGGGSGMTTIQGSGGGSGMTTIQGSGGGSGMTTIQGSGGGSGMTTIQGSGGGSGMTTIQETVVQRNIGGRGGSGMTIVQAGGGGFTFGQGSGGGSGMATVQGSGGGSGVTTVQETVVQRSGGGSSFSSSSQSSSSHGLTLNVDNASPRLNRHGLWERAGGIDEIAGFTLSTSPTRLSGGSFTSDSGGSDTQISTESPDSGRQKSVVTRTVTTTRSTKGGGDVTVEETTSSQGGKVTSTKTVTGNPDLLGSNQRHEQSSVLKSELNVLDGNLTSSQISNESGFSLTPSHSEGDFNQGLGSDLDRNRMSSSHSSVNTSFDSENGTLKSCIKRSKSDTQVKKGISFASTVVGGTDSEESTDEESGNEEAEGSDSSYEEGSYDGRHGNIVYQCKDDEAIAKGIPGAKMFDQNIRETFELSQDMRTSCKVLATYLVDSTTIKTSELNTNLGTIQKEWFNISSQKLSDHYQVEDFMSSFNEISKKLLEYIVNMADPNGNTALHYAVSNCNFDVCNLFLDSGVVDVNKQNKAGYTPVMLASLAYIQTHGQIETVRRLFKQGDVNVRSTQAGQTALMLAISHGRTNMVEFLLDAGADVNAHDNDGSTALMCACEHGHNDIVKVLLSHPATDANLTDNDGSTALSIAMEAGHKDIGVVLYAHLNFSKTSPGLVRKRKSSSSPTPSRHSR